MAPNASTDVCPRRRRRGPSSLTWGTSFRSGGEFRISVVPGRDDLDVAIAREVARLVELDQLRAEVQERIERLRADSDRSPAAAPAPDAELTAERKLAVFARLFRGREDVFPGAVGEARREPQRLVAELP